jgi:putative redox protein
MVTTVRLYAERRQIALHRIEARAHREPPSGKIASIETELLLDGDLDEEQRRKLHEVAARCPVTRTLSEGARITHV